jgi:hypothetical protein
MVTTFDFAFEPAYRLLSLPFGVRPSTAQVTMSEELLVVRFGPWRLNTGLGNIIDARLAGPFRLLRTAGPARLSLADRGLTFATNSHQGVCVRFAEAVPGIECTGRLRHPNLTVTVTDCAALLAALAR